MAMIDRIRTEVVLQGRRNNQCWFGPGMTVVPPRNGAADPEVHIGVSQLTGNDIGTKHWIRTHDRGRTWSPPMESQNLLAIPREDDFFEKVGIGLFHHRKSDRLLGFGSTQFVRDQGSDWSFKMEAHDWSKECTRQNTMASTEWDFERGDFRPWQPLSVPSELGRFHRYAFPHVQHEMPDGTVLAATYVLEEAGQSYYGAVAMRLHILPEGGIRLLEMGNILRHDTVRGLCEPSIVKFGDRFFMTLRHDDTAYCAVGDDGLRYGEPVEWRFDDGERLGNYNTQQHWLAHEDALYLLYNRRHELNNGVFRSRAPLFIAQVDPEQLRVIRDTEQIVFPEKGARMGNFSVANVTDKEAWVVTGEWLQQQTPEIEPGARFYRGDADFNRIQYIGDLLLGRIIFR